MNNFKSCVPCVCTGSGRRRVCEEHNNNYWTLSYIVCLKSHWILGTNYFDGSMNNCYILGGKFNFYFYNYLDIKLNHNGYQEHKILLVKNEQLVCFGAKFYVFFLPIATLWNSLKCNVIQRIKKCGPTNFDLYLTSQSGLRHL